MVQAKYLPGLHNAEVDWHSSYLLDSSDWMLDPGVFVTLSTLWRPFQVDLFASQTNVQLVRYFSWCPDQGVEVVDAFLQDWSRGL